MGNKKWTRKDQGHQRISVFVSREGFSKISQDKLDNQGSGLLNLLRSSDSFLILKKTRKGWSGLGHQKLYKNTNPNVVDYKGLVRAITFGATTTIRGIERKLR